MDKAQIRETIARRAALELKDGGKGLDGVVAKGEHYSNPFIELMKGRR